MALYNTTCTQNRNLFRFECHYPLVHEPNQRFNELTTLQVLRRLMAYVVLWSSTSFHTLTSRETATQGEVFIVIIIIIITIIQTYQVLIKTPYSHVRYS